MSSFLVESMRLPYHGRVVEMSLRQPLEQNSIEFEVYHQQLYFEGLLSVNLRYCTIYLKLFPQCDQREPNRKISVRALRTSKHSSFTSLLTYLVPELNPDHDDKLNPRASGVLHMELILHNSETSVEYDEFHLENCHFKEIFCQSHNL